MKIFNEPGDQPAKILTLTLPLKASWFEMTKAGIKTEDYREITPYWVKRLTRIYDEEDAQHAADYLSKERDPASKVSNFRYGFCLPKIFEVNIMTLGYPKSTYTGRILRLEHKRIKIATGNPDWGAEPNKLYFVIMHGKSDHPHPTQ